MSSFYTNFFRKGSDVYIRRIDNGVRSMETVSIKPVLYVRSNKDLCDQVSLYNEPLKSVEFDSVNDANRFIDEYKGMKMPLYGFPRFEYNEINKLFPGADGVDFDLSKIIVSIIDIETKVENGKFPDPELAEEEISLISVTFGEQCYTLSVWDEGCNFENTTFVYCENEETLLSEFMKLWVRNYPDVISGWNNKFFDIPYLYNRIDRLFGETVAAKLSPFKRITKKTEEGKFGGVRQVITLHGIATLDYLELYQKFTYSVQESYKLDFIAELELGRKKLENPYSSFREHYINDPKSFILYNRIDVDLVQALEKKNKFIELACTVAYSSKVNYEDVFKNIRVWDVIIANYLASKNIQGVAYFSVVSADQFEGAYVKDPLKGKYEMIASFDLESLYPSIMIQQNTSPETYIGRPHPLSARDVLEYTNSWKAAIEKATNENATLCANGAMFSKEEVGHIPYLVDRGFRARKEAKNTMISKQKQLELVKAEKQRRGLL